MCELDYTELDMCEDTDTDDEIGNFLREFYHSLTDEEMTELILGCDISEYDKPFIPTPEHLRWEEALFRELHGE